MLGETEVETVKRGEHCKARPSDDVAVLLSRVGSRVRARRLDLGWTVKGLAERSGLSPRFVSQLEAGQGNIAIGRLSRVASALDIPLSSLVEGGERDLAATVHQLLRGRSPEELRRAIGALEVLFGQARPQIVALLGLRGAGKSTVGQGVAQVLGFPFVELDEQIEAEAGLTLGEVFALHGEPYYRRLEARCLLALLARREPMIVALSGGVVHNEEAFALVHQRCTSVWLRARPGEYMERVRAQGDERPMANRSDAMAELRAILHAREPLYRLADIKVDTSQRAVEDIVGEVVRRIT